MAKVDETRSRKRMVVEEVGTPQVAAEGVVETAPLEEIKEKVEELQTLTEGISESAEKSAEVQEELVEATEKVIPIEASIPTDINQGPNEFIPLNTRSSGPNPLVIIIPGILLLGALLGGIVFYQKSLSDANVDEAVVPEATTEATASTPTPSTAVVDLTKYTVNILNGSGTPGEAGKVKTLLEAAKFTVGTTGNASAYDFTKTIVKAKSTVDAAFVAKLIETLGKTYEVDKAQTLSDSSKNDVEVTVGSSKK